MCSRGVPSLLRALRQSMGTSCSTSHLASSTYCAQLGANNQSWNRLTQQSSSLQSLRCFAEQAQSGKSWGGDKPPVSMQTLLIGLMAGAGGLAALKQYKDEKIQQVMSQSQEVAGKASIGGPFSLIDQDGKTFTNQDLLGEFNMLYFGFCHCPDICPDELEKLAEAINAVEKQTGVQIRPVFITVDPERDTPARVKAYCREFHPRMIGLTGDIENIKKTSKSYRVYYNKTTDSTDDYLVDHSIIHYLLDPRGEFVTFYSKSYTSQQMADSLMEHVVNWKKEHPEYRQGQDIKLPAHLQAK